MMTRKGALRKVAPMLARRAGVASGVAGVSVADAVGPGRRRARALATGVKSKV